MENENSAQEQAEEELARRDAESTLDRLFKGQRRAERKRAKRQAQLNKIMEEENLTEEQAEKQLARQDAESAQDRLNKRQRRAERERAKRQAQLQKIDPEGNLTDEQAEEALTRHRADLAQDTRNKRAQHKLLEERVGKKDAKNLKEAHRTIETTIHKYMARKSVSYEQAIEEIYHQPHVNKMLHGRWWDRLASIEHHNSGSGRLSVGEDGRQSPADSLDEGMARNGLAGNGMPSAGEQNGGLQKPATPDMIQHTSTSPPKPALDQDDSAPELGGLGAGLDRLTIVNDIPE